MEIIFLLIPLSLLLVGAALWAFFWAVKNGQFDDLDAPALDILDDDSSTSESCPMAGGQNLSDNEKGSNPS